MTSTIRRKSKSPGRGKLSKLFNIFVLIAFLFTMILGSLSVAQASESVALSDLEGHWAQGTVEKLVKEGVVSGYPDGTFRPDKNITRAEFAVLTVRVFHLKAGPGKTFDDTAGHWAEDVIKTANYHGVVEGYSEDAFGPDDPITREQMATMIVNATKADSQENSKIFTDGDQIADWAREFVDKAAATGLIAGYPDGTFRPQAHATRAEAATVLDKGKKLVEKLLLTTYDQAGTYGPETETETIDGDVVISTDGVILQNTIITGNLTISEKVGDGDVTLNKVTVKGTTFIRGGGKDSIHINGGQYSNMVIESTSEGGVRLVATDVEGLPVVISEDAAGEEIVLEGAFKSVEIKADNVVLTTTGKTTIDELKVEEKAAGAVLNMSLSLMPLNLSDVVLRDIAFTSGMLHF